MDDFNEIYFDPERMTLATPEDVERMYRALWGDKPRDRRIGMKIDEIEYDIAAVLDNGLGHYADDERAERALLWMEKGWIKKSPRPNWIQSGWKITPLGKKHVANVLAEVRKRHGHEWETHHDSDPDTKKDAYGKSINWFALSEGYHNGPRCKKCGFEFCHHCESEWEVVSCKK